VFFLNPSFSALQVIKFATRPVYDIEIAYNSGKAFGETHFFKRSSVFVAGKFIVTK
jgi:hypothetical protein